MKIKTIGLACAITVSALSGCRRSPQISPKIKTHEIVNIDVVKAVKKDTTYFFLYKKIYHQRNFKGKNVIDTICGYLKAESDDIFTFIQNGKQLPKGAKQIGRQQKNGTFNYIY